MKFIYILLFIPTLSYGQVARGDNNPFSASAGGTISAATTISPTLTVVGTATVTGNAFSVGGSTLVVSGGKVGVGTTSPQTLLEISKGTSGGEGGVIVLRNSIEAAGSYTGIISNDTNSPARGYEKSGLFFPAIGSNGHTDIMLAVQNNTFNAVSPTNASGYLYLKNATGNVGIGTTAPNTKLHISSGTLTMDGTGSPTAGYALCFQANKQMGKCTSLVGADGTCTCGAP